jgi:hypothetical protein
MPRFLALIVLLLLGLDGCCHCPPPPSPRTEAAPPSLRLPTGLGSPHRSPPGSLAALLKELRTSASSFAAFRDALAPYLGGRVRWQLRSWGGDLTTKGCVTPSGKQPAEVGGTRVGRIRFISPALDADANLVTVRDAGQPIVSCLSVFPADDDPRFVRSDGKRAVAPAGGVVTIEATIWGVTSEGHANLWLHDCALVE